MKTKLLLSIAFGAILCTSSFYQVEAIKKDQKGRHHVNHQAKHDAENHTDAVGIVTLNKAQKFKILPDKTMVPLTDVATSLHVATTPENDHPELHQQVLAALKDDQKTATLFNLSFLSELVKPVIGIGTKIVGAVASNAGKIVKGVVDAGKSLLSNEGVKQAAKEAIVGGGIGAALSIGSSVISTGVDIAGGLLGGGSKKDQDSNQDAAKDTGKNPTKK